MVDDRSKPYPSDKPSACGREPAQTPGRTTSRALLGSGRELIIEHDGREYRLRLTHQGKLILTA